MKTKLYPIKRNETSKEVSVLHKAIKALGFPIGTTEAKQRKAGKDTIAAINALRKNHNIPEAKDLLANDAVLEVIQEQLKNRGLAKTENSFTVRGRVGDESRKVRRNQELIAFDLDLKGIGKLSTLKSIDEVGEDSGFEYLGTTLSDNRGRYSITFYDWQYSRHERKKADVVVFAVQKDTIIGRSRMVNVGDYSAKGLVSNLNIFVSTDDKRTEYRKLSETILPFFKENKCRPGDIAESSDQLVFTSNELDVSQGQLLLFAQAENLLKTEQDNIAHQLLYGIGRQKIELSWNALFKKKEEELLTAINTSVSQNLIAKPKQSEVKKLLKLLRTSAIDNLLKENKDNPDSLDALLSNSLSTKKQKTSFLNAVQTFKGVDYSKFWSEYLPKQEEFKENPKLIERLLHTQRLTVLTGNNPKLVDLLSRQKTDSVEKLMSLSNDNWAKLIAESGVPETVKGKDDKEKATAYSRFIQNSLNAAFPTIRIAIDLKANGLPGIKNAVAKKILSFFKKNPDFSFGSSRVLDFQAQLKDTGGEQATEILESLTKIERLYQVSANPEAIGVLMKNNFNSARAIADVPKKSFTASYGADLGGEKMAFAIHERASYVSTKVELAATNIHDHLGLIPDYILPAGDIEKLNTTLDGQIPNWKELFGSPDICECEHCRSVYSPAAYFVDLLRFLWRGEKNTLGKNPLDQLESRRPDLLHLALTCENSHTIIPYIDLVNEILEFYTANGSLTNYKGYNTGETTSEELRANPQNLNMDAYQILQQMVYPFTLPYHQPLDVIRIYTDHLKTSRHSLMELTRNDVDKKTDRAISAEKLGLSPKEYEIISTKKITGGNATTPLPKYYGYNNAAQLENAAAVNEFLSRSGIKYTDLVALLETKFINPFRPHLEFLEALFADATITADVLYIILKAIADGSTDTASEPLIKAALKAYNLEHGTSISNSDLDTWVIDHFAEFQQVITLYEPESKCALDTTSLKTLKSIYEGLTTSDISDEIWSKMHRFIRLWRKLDWTIAELDIVLNAFGASDIDPIILDQLADTNAVAKETKLSAQELACLWGNINTLGEKSLYENLFLNKSAQEIRENFEADQWGNYLQDTSQDIENHKDYILAAYRITEDELNAILEVAQLKDATGIRPITTTDVLSLESLSEIYRYVLLAKSLKMKIMDLVDLIKLFELSPFSIFNTQTQQYENILPAATKDAITLLQSVKTAGFKADELSYIIDGTIKADSKIALDEEKVLQTIKDIRAAFATIETDHPDSPEIPLTLEDLKNKLGYTFDSVIVTEFAEIVDGMVTHEILTDANLDVTISEELSPKYTYSKGSGRLTVTGVMTDDERTKLKALTNTNTNFDTAVDTLYNLPADFMATHFSGILTDAAERDIIILDRPPQGTVASTLDEKIDFVYQAYLPTLKSKLREDALIQHIGAIISLDNEQTSLLLETQLAQIIAQMTQYGYTGIYFSDDAFSTEVLRKRADQLDFDWGTAIPETGIPADDFSVRWEAYLAPPASGEHTLQVNVHGTDEAFSLFLDDEMILEKTAGTAATSLEVTTELNAAVMHHLRLDYVEGSGEALVNLKWKTEGSALENIPLDYLYAADGINEFILDTAIFKRAALFISNFSLSATEINHFTQNTSNFSAIDFYALTTEHWKRTRDYKELTKAVPQSQGFITEVFDLANASIPPTVDELIASLLLATAWEETSLTYLVNDHFGLAVDDFKNEIALSQLLKIMTLVNSSGITAETLCILGETVNNFNVFIDNAQLLKNAVRSKYDEKTWMELASDLNDKSREHQKDALIAYILQRPAIKTKNITDANGLFEYFLIDVDMSACMDTSRIVQANSSIQQFVARCQLNLESDRTSGNEEGVSPNYLDAERWEWMKYYRVWEANRKVFITPENWLEPEWRMDRSEFFKELESHLLQNDITDSSVEDGFRNYLARLNEVANLEVCGSYRETYEDSSKLKFLHVFARTNNAPFKYFYRRWNEFEKWGAWETVAADIQSVNKEDTFGVPLIPVVWKNRLFLFWAEFFEISSTSSATSNKSIQEVEQDSISSLEADKDWQVKLAWSEYVDEKWTPKQLSNAHMILYGDLWNEASASFSSSIDTITQELRISFWVNQDFATVSDFVLSDIQAPIKISTSFYNPYTDFSQYTSDFQKRQRDHKLELNNNTYLTEKTNHTLLGPNNHGEVEKNPTVPFFYTGDNRTYFVNPSAILTLGPVQHPEYYEPFLPQLEPEYTKDLIFPVDPSDPVDPSAPTGPDTFDPPTWEGALGLVSEPFEYTISGNTMLPVSSTYEAEYILPANYRAGGQPRLLNKSQVVANQSIHDAIYEVPGAMGGYEMEAEVWEWFPLPLTQGLEFHTFYHPYSSEYVKNLNTGGISKGSKSSLYPPGLMESDTFLTNDEGQLFENTYDPVFTNGYVQKPADFSDPNRTYYKENVCFDPLGANSIYNWELFFHAPLYVASRLSKNGKYKEALKWFHYIFNPTTDELPKAGDPEVARYWQVLPFKTALPQSMEDWFKENLDPNSNPLSENNMIAEWRDNPFDTHNVASNRPLAYMKNVIIKYVENLLSWGDSLFRQHSMESVNEALQLYVIASHILGKRPEFVPKRGTIKAETYSSLIDKWDDFSNALVELENIFPYSSSVPVSNSDSGINLMGIGSSFYFCIPSNEKLLEYWDTVEDRLFKIRHCQDINGIESKLALFSPPIDPAALINAAAKGLSLGSILADLSSPAPLYRFTYLVQKSNEFCNDVKALGSALLSAYEKKDAEELSLLRASQETMMQELIISVRERNVLEAKANKENLEMARETAKQRLQYYTDILGNESLTIPDVPTLSADLNADSSLPASTNLPQIEVDVDVSLSDSRDAGVKLIPREREDLTKSDWAKWLSFGAGIANDLGAILSLIPQVDTEGTPLGVGVGAAWGGQNLGFAANAAGRALSNSAQFASAEAAQASKMASYARRDQEWTFQANMAARQIVEVDKQLVAADIRIQVTEKELANHLKTIENTKEVELFVKDKFSNQELYQWMKEQLYSVYKQSYNLAYDMAKKTEKAYQYEMGVTTSSFVQYGYWDDSKKGLVAGEKLQLALRQIEKAYLEENKREFELTKHVSMQRLDPLALLELKRTGQCYVSLPEELFDMDYQGHYFRRLKSVQLSIPCIAGPHITVNCSLRLLSNDIRINTSLNEAEEYQHNNDEGLFIEDTRFRSNNVPVTSIATSSGQNDTGMFEFNFRDERYLPFEGAGAISEWQLELTTTEELRQFDYDTISDVIMHLNYTARESGGTFKEAAISYLKDFIVNTAEIADQPFKRLFSLKHEFSTAWHQFLYPAVAGAEQLLTLALNEDHFPFFAGGKTLNVKQIDVLFQSVKTGDYKVIISALDKDDPTTTLSSTEQTAPELATYGNLQMLSLSGATSGLDVEAVDAKNTMSLMVRHSSSAADDFTALETNPEELENMYMVVHYSL